jgi:tetratricopeptide (TPR) repeat protein
MTVEIFKGRLFQYGHERRALGVFLHELNHRFADADELYIVVIEVDANGANLDLLLLSPRAVIVVDIKELTGAAYATPTAIHLLGKENGAWQYQPGDGRQPIRLGGARNKSNPYKQVEQNRHNFAEWLSQHGKAVNNDSWDKRAAMDCTRGWVTISPGFDGKTDDLLLPWEQIHTEQDWFKVRALTDLAWEFHCTTANAIHFTENELHRMVDLLGAEPVTNLSQVLPGHINPKAPLPGVFCSIQPLAELVGRAEELDELTAWLEDANSAFLSLEGMGGIGKSTLLRRMAGTPVAQKWHWQYLSSRDAQLTPERFLSAVAADIPDDARAHHLIPPEPSLIELPDEDRRVKARQERLTAALDYLESSRTLLILEDFHAQRDETWTHELLRGIAARNGRVKCLIAGREHPTLLDHPDFGLQSTTILCLQGLALEDSAALLRSKLGETVSDKIAAAIHTKTGGNPYLIHLLLPCLRRTGWNQQLANLPLYISDRDHWFDTLVENLSPQALEIAEQLALIRAPVDSNLIAVLCPDPGTAFGIFNELVDGYILQRAGPVQNWQLPDALADYLEGKHARPEIKEATLRAAGRNFLLQAQGEEQRSTRQMDLQYQALTCYQRAGLSAEFPARIFRQLAHGLFKAGRGERAAWVLQTAYERAIKSGSLLQQADWLLEIAEISLQDTDYQAARAAIDKAAALLTDGGEAETSAELARQKLQARIHLGRGRIAYHQSHLNQAESEYQQALEIAAVTQQTGLRTEAVLRLARAARLRGDLPTSRTQFEAAMRLPGVRRDKHTYVEVLSHLGLIARSEGDVAAARAAFTRAARLAKRTQDVNAYEINRSLLADLERRQGNYASAARMFKDCLDVSMRMGSGLGIRVNLGQLAECLIQQDKLREALPILKEAYSRCQQAGDQIGIAWNYRRRGLYMKKKGDQAGGDAWILRGLQLLREIGSTIYIEEFKKDLNPEQVSLPGFSLAAEEPFF